MWAGGRGTAREQAEHWSAGGAQFHCVSLALCVYMEKYIKFSLFSLQFSPPSHRRRGRELANHCWVKPQHLTKFRQQKPNSCSYSLIICRMFLCCIKSKRILLLLFARSLAFTGNIRRIEVVNNMLTYICFFVYDYKAVCLRR